MRRKAVVGALTAGLVAPVAVALGAPVATPLKPAPSAADAAFFESKIRPLLLERCGKCHGEKVQQGGLRLDTVAGLRKGSDSGPVIVGSDAEKSPLLRVVRHQGGLQMPPGEKLPEAEIAALTAWVKAGAPWPAAGARGQGSSGGAEKSGLHWAFQPVRRPALPRVKNKAWIASPIDAFILAKLEAKGIAPSPKADPRTLIRRATFDLTGLPPTPEEVEAFLRDCREEASTVRSPVPGGNAAIPGRSMLNARRPMPATGAVMPRAYARLIDRLLASPAYGERWGRHWLDLARYADSKDVRDIGQPFDIVESYRYRDWVVKAVNEDLPYDQFIRHQIAGDLLPAPAPGEVNADGIVASTFLTIGVWGPGDADVQKMYADMVDDQVNAVSRAFLGLTIGCARCHDHKFDPISAADYYGLAGIFFSTQIAIPQISAPYNKVPLVPQAEIERRERYMARVPEMEKNIQAYLDARYAELPRQLIPETGRYLNALWELQHPAAGKAPEVAALARSSGLREEVLRQWVEYLSPTPPQTGLMTNLALNSGAAGVHAWRGAANEPVLVVNTTDQTVTIPGTVPPRSVAIHPGPTTGVAVAWDCAEGGTFRVTGRVAHAHPACGDGIEWQVERVRAGAAERLVGANLPLGGESKLTEPALAEKLTSIRLAPGDQLRFVVLPKTSHSCDLTQLDVQVEAVGGTGRVWSLARDLCAGPFQPGEGNPHRDSFGSAGRWSFIDMAQVKPVIRVDRSPASALRQWLMAADREQSARAAAGLQQALTSSNLQEVDGPLGKLWRDLASPQGPYRVTRKDEALLPSTVLAEKKRLESELEAYRKNAPPPIPYAMGAKEGGVPGTKYAGFHDAQIHIRGRYDRLGEVVPRRFPLVIAGQKQPPITKGSGRMELAHWIASRENPLTARVLVNRVWQHHFGAGLVRTPGNFGKLGEAPTHPELLDWLAAAFSGVPGSEFPIPSSPPAKIGSARGTPNSEPAWSLKQLHRTIMLSSTYQQSTKPRPELRMDPENRLWARANVRRLEAEAIRDTLLSVAGTLDRTVGGPPLRKPGEDALSRRRAIYMMTNRSDKSGFRFLYDAADPENIVDQRTVSTVAPQSLFLLNDPFMQEQTRALAERLLATPDRTNEQRITQAYELLYGRVPRAAELALGLAFVHKHAGADSAQHAAWQEYCQVLLCANELIYLD